MYYNRNLITATEHPVTRGDASGVFNLQSQVVDQNQKEWPGSETASIIYDVKISPDTLTIEVPSAGTVDYTIDWGDGTIEASEDNAPSHTYASVGDYKIKIFSDAVYRPYVNGGGNTNFEKSVVKIEITEKANLGTELANGFAGLKLLNTFKCFFSATSNVTSAANLFRGCSLIGNFDVFDTSNMTNVGGFFFNARLGFYPQLDFSSATVFSNIFREVYGVSALPYTDTSSCVNFSNAWRLCVISTFPSFYDFSSGTTFGEGWRSAGIYNFPANMFDSTGTLNSYAFNNAFNGCRLTSQSIENILTSLVTNGQTGITLHIGYGTNAAYSTWSSAAQTALATLQSRSWNVTYNT